ncbi:MAG: asparaginase [Arcobacter sp.]|nr:asparaginase [Arcobacter sp.]
MNRNLIIINVGGTFNKVYNPLNGELLIPTSNQTIFEIVHKVCKTKNTISIDGLIYKDSLQMDKNDRLTLLEKIKTLKETKIIIIHGTDTMKKSAKVLSKFIKDKTIIFVGAMQPYSIEPVEASATLFMALGFLKNIKNKDSKNKMQGVYICMNGLIAKYNKIKKNYEKGVFECL